MIRLVETSANVIVWDHRLAPAPDRDSVRLRDWTANCWTGVTGFRLPVIGLPRSDPASRRRPWTDNR